MDTREIARMVHMVSTFLLYLYTFAPRILRGDPFVIAVAIAAAWEFTSHYFGDVLRLYRRRISSLLDRALYSSARHVHPAFALRQDGGGGRGGDGRRVCAVCFDSLTAGDVVRSLPVCTHMFHADCVDPWLRLHATCPLCRSDAFL